MKYVRLMLEVPASTPKIALRAETGLLSMKHWIWSEKVSLDIALKRSKGGLAGALPRAASVWLAWACS